MKDDKNTQNKINSKRTNATNHSLQHQENTKETLKHLNSKKFKFVIWFFAIILTALVVGFSAFMLLSKGEERKVQTETKLNLYFLNTAENKLEPEQRYIKNEESSLMLKSVLNELFAGPKASMLASTKTDNINFYGEVKLDDAKKIVELTFTEDYKKLSPPEEVLFRAALVWTLTELDFVENIHIYVEDEELLKSDGTPIGLLNRNNVKIEAGEVPVKKIEEEVIVYFADENAMSLVPEVREIIISSSFTVERSIVQALIDGPKNPKNISVIPKETKILDIKTEEKICYVDLSSDFITKFTGGSTAEQFAVYSIVNSLTELQKIQKVQILVDGDKKYELGGNMMDISSPFERNESLISK